MFISAEEVIQILDLKPHPEGGAFRETYRSSVLARTDAQRSVCTAIYFLIRKDQATAWHRVKNDEIYHFYSGAPVELSLIHEDGKLSKHILGTNVKNGERPQIIIPANEWQSARSLGDYSLFGCTVSPGFDFSDFELIETAKLQTRYPELELT